MSKEQNTNFYSFLKSRGVLTLHSTIGVCFDRYAANVSSAEFEVDRLVFGGQENLYDGYSPDGQKAILKSIQNFTG